MFKKKVEDFVCEHCGNPMKGSGYTNHCSMCLWSKHVDNSPGDRAQDCRGMMEPIKIESEKGEFIISHQCIECQHIKRNKASSADNLDILFQKMNKKSVDAN